MCCPVYIGILVRIPVLKKFYFSFIPGYEWGAFVGQVSWHVHRAKRAFGAWTGQEACPTDASQLLGLLPGWPSSGLSSAAHALVPRTCRCRRPVSDTASPTAKTAGRRLPPARAAAGLPRLRHSRERSA